MKFTYKLIGFPIWLFLFVVITGFEDSQPANNIDKTSVKIFEKSNVPVYIPRCKDNGSSCQCRRISYSMRGDDYEELLRGMQSLPALQKKHTKSIELFYQTPNEISIYSVENTGCEILLTQMLIDKTHNKVEKMLKDSRERYKESGNKKKYKYYDYYLKELNKLAIKIGM